MEEVEQLELEGADAWSIVTVTYNSAEPLRRFWADRPRPPWLTWIVVDNASSDGSAQLAEALGADLVIPLPKNVGFSAANNLGWRAASTDLILFANPDLEVGYEDLPTLSRRLADGDSLVAPQFKNVNGALQPNGRGMPFLWAKVLNRLRPSGSPGYRVFAREGETVVVAWLMGAAVATHRKVLERIAGWDDAFFVYYEDADLGLRAWEAGVPSYVIGEVTWTHGWARETKHWRLAPWKLELASMRTFYRRYPQLLLPPRFAARRFPAAWPAVGHAVTAENGSAR